MYDRKTGGVYITPPDCSFVGRHSRKFVYTHEALGSNVAEFTRLLGVNLIYTSKNEFFNTHTLVYSGEISIHTVRCTEQTKSDL